MPRPEKVQAVADIKERLDGAEAVFLAEYAGLSVKDQQALRRGLRESGAEFKVVKMTLARRAAAELELTDLDELFLGPTGIAFAEGDPVNAAKALKGFASEHETFIIKGGLLGREFLSPERISELADIEPRDVLLAKMAGAMQAPMAKLAGLLAALPRNLAMAIQQLLEKREADGGGAAEAPADDTPPVEDATETPEATTGDATDAEGSASDSAPDDEAEDETASAEEAVADPVAEDESGGDDAESGDETTAESAEEE